MATMTLEPFLQVMLFTLVVVAAVAVVTMVTSMRQITQSISNISDSLRETVRSQTAITVAQREQSQILQSLVTQVAVIDARGHPNE